MLGSVDIQKPRTFTLFSAHLKFFSRKSFSFFPAIDPIHRASAFVLLSLRPDTLPNLSIVSRVADKASLVPLRMKVVPSAYWLILISVYDTKCFSSVFESLMCIKNDSKLKTGLKFLKASFFAGKRPYFSLENCPGDWDRIYRIVTSIDLIAFTRTQCVCYKSLKMLTLFSSMGDLFETSKTYSEKGQVGEKMELSLLGASATRNLCQLSQVPSTLTPCWFCCQVD